MSILFFREQFEVEHYRLGTVIRFIFFTRINPITDMDGPAIRKAQREIIDWCEEQFGDEGYQWESDASSFYALGVDFRLPSDAAVFKLRFC